MRILVCGGRKYADCEKVWSTLDEYQRKHGPLTIIQGGATGADYLAREWTYKQKGRVTLINVPADWDKHGKAAGPIRNSEMLDEDPDLVIAFRGGAGTEDMVRKAKKACVPVERID
jgi:hypothetical protein